MSNRHRRALRWMLAVAAVLVGPVSYRIYLQSKAGDVASPKLGDVGEFVYHDTAGSPWTIPVLRRSVTLVLHIPKNCRIDSCGLTWSQAASTMTWVQSHLTIKHAEEKNPLNLLVTGGNESFVPQEGWAVIRETIDPGTLVPTKFDIQKPWLVAIDPDLNFAGGWSLAEPLPQETIERVLSRTTFDQYMGNYLARRTFMGPRKK